MKEDFEQFKHESFTRVLSREKSLEVLEKVPAFQSAIEQSDPVPAPRRHVSCTLKASNLCSEWRSSQPMLEVSLHTVSFLFLRGNEIMDLCLTNVSTQSNLIFCFSSSVNQEVSKLHRM